MEVILRGNQGPGSRQRPGNPSGLRSELSLEHHVENPTLETDSDASDWNKKNMEINGTAGTYGRLVGV